MADRNDPFGWLTKEQTPAQNARMEKALDEIAVDSVTAYKAVEQKLMESFDTGASPLQARSQASVNLSYGEYLTLRAALAVAQVVAADEITQ